MDILFAALLLVLAGGLAPLALHRWLSAAKVAHVSLVAAGCLTGLYGVYAAWGQSTPVLFSCPWLHSLTWSLSLDSLATAFLPPIFLLAPVIALYSYDYLDAVEHAWRTAVNHFFFSLLVAAMVLVTLADNMAAFALAWELMSLSSYALVLYDYESEETQRAAHLYLLFTQTGALLVFAAFGLLAQSTGSLAFAQIHLAPETAKTAAFFLALIGFGSKAGVFPLHIWLPHAHPAAPSHVSALMSGVMIKMGVYGILRLYFLLNDFNPLFARTVLVLGMVSGVLGVVYALSKREIKRLLAYSSIENIGVIFIGCGLGMVGLSSGNRIMAAFGFAGGLLHVLNHALFKSLLFMGAGAILHTVGARKMDQLGGLMKTMPVTGRTFLAGSVAISGLPPFNGFVSEFLIYYAAFQGLGLQGPDFLLSMAAIIALALIGGLAAGCFTKVVGIVFLGEPRREHAHAATDPGPTMGAAMTLLAVACLGIGLWPEPFIRFAFAGLRDLAPLAAVSADVLGAVPHNLAVIARVFVGLLLALTALRRLLYRGKPVSQNTTWGCGFTQATSRIQYTGASYSLSMVDFHRPFIKTTTKFAALARIFPGATQYSRKVEDLAEIGLHRLLVRPVLKIADKLRWIQHGHIQLYIGYIVLTIAGLLLVV